jgi:hypothetical protein
MDPEELKSYLRVYLKCKGEIILLKHCKERMSRRGVSIDDMLYVINWGKIKDLQWDNERQNFKCKFEGTDVDGDELVLIAAIDKDRNEIICITIY